LAESIHYDFVITQEMFDKYMEQHPTYTVVEVGKLIASNSDGTDPASYSFLAKAPVSVFIAAKIPNTVALEFASTFITPSNNGIVDLTDFITNGEFTTSKTDGAADIYSQYPYNVNGVSGGINFHSTSKAPITITSSVQYSGVIRIGSYKTSTTGPIIVKRNGAVKIYTQEQLSGYGFDDELTESQSPGVFVADWMGGGCSGDLGYSIDEADTVQYGLFDRFAESYRLGTRAYLFVRHAQSTSVYHRDHGSSYDTTFSNASEGRQIIIHKDGTITKKDVGIASGGGLSAHTVITDFALTELVSPPNPNENEYQSSPLSSILNNGWDRVRVIRPTYTGFKSIKGETGIRGFTWYCPYGTGGAALFKFGESNVVDWFKWHCLSALNTKPSPQKIDWVLNSRGTLFIDFEDLKPGVVYEINIHIVQLPVGDYEAGTLGRAMQQAYPNEHVSNPAYVSYDGNVPNMSIQFYNPASNTQYTNVVCFWGSDAHLVTGWQGGGYPKFHKHSNVASYPTSTVRSNTLEDIAVATIRFVKLDGKIYIMTY
jgi:hypothetical protein